MADCNSIESLLNQVLTNLDAQNGRFNSLEARVAKLEADMIFNLLKNEEQDREFFRINIILEALRLGGGNELKNRIKRAEDRILKSERELKFTDKKVNNVNSLVTRLTARVTSEINRIGRKLGQLDNKNTDQDKKISDADEQLTGIKAAIAAIIAAGGIAAYLAAKLAPLIAKQTAADKAIDSIKNLLQKRGTKGEKGDKGDKGDRGDKGSKGDKGDQGQTGQKGDKGQTGSKGDKGEQGQDGQKGDQGQTGQKGDKGQTGSKGDKGDRGDRGLKGDRGQTGQKGDKGDVGEAGQKGDKGEEGQVQIVERDKIVYKDPEYESCLIKKFDKCDLVTNDPVFTFETIQVIKGHGLATKKLFEQIAEIDALQCNPPEAIAAIPEYWTVRPMADRPQLVVMFGEVLPNNKFGSAKYPICIPHYFGREGSKPIIPNYKKGQIEGKLTLKDNSKLVVNADSEAEAERVINAIKPYIDPLMIVGNKVQFTNRKGQNLAKITVAPRNLRFFSTGQKSSKPDYFDLY